MRLPQGVRRHSNLCAWSAPNQALSTTQWWLTKGLLIQRRLTIKQNLLLSSLLLSTCLITSCSLLAGNDLSQLPLQGTDTTSSSTTAHKTNRRVANLDLIWDVEDLDLGSKLLGLTKGGVLLVDHHITRARHVVLVQTLDIQANVVTWLCKVNTLVVHLDSEHLASARVGWSPCWQEDHLFVRLHNTLLDTACEDITDSLDLVDARNWHAHWSAGGSLW